VLGVAGENLAFSASRRWARSKTSSVTSAGTGISIHSSRGRPVTPTRPGVVRPASREVRFGLGPASAVRVLPNAARPMYAGLRSIRPSDPASHCAFPFGEGTWSAVSSRARASIETPPAAYRSKIRATTWASASTIW
jgi:hypothetical protein